MAKFHINGKGVPSLRRATKGNCPFGDGQQHYSSLEKAQEAIDTQNQKEHTLLPSMKNNNVNVKVGWDSVEEVFGYPKFGEDNMSLGTYSDYLADGETEGTSEIFSALPKDLQNEALNGNGFIAVSDKNSKEYVMANVLSNQNYYGNEESNKYFDNEILPTIKNNSPESVKSTEYGDEVDTRKLSEIAEFAQNTLKEESNFTINNQTIYIDGDSEVTKKYSGKIHNRNWAKEYFENNK